MSILLALLLLLFGGFGGMGSDAYSSTEPAYSANERELHAQLRSAATAEETYLTDHGTYTTSVKDLESEGHAPVDGVTLTILNVTADGYCMKATMVAGNTSAYYDGYGNGVTDEPCGPAE